MSPHSRRPRLIAALTIAALGMAQAACAGDPPMPPQAPAEGFSAGIDIRADASASDVGLPVYPGASVQRDAGDDKASFSLGLWGGAFGFKLSVLKFASDDGMDDVAFFYRRALSRYGPVLDCSQPEDPARQADKAALHCDGDKPTANGRVFKVGTPRLQRIVTMKQVGKAVHFQLTRVETKSDARE